MKKVFNYLLTFLIIALLCAFTACSAGGTINDEGISVPNDIEITAEQFNDFFAAEKYSSYELEDYSTQFIEELEYPITSYIIADSEEDEITVELMIFETENTAKECYGNYAVEMDAEITADTVTVEETNEDHAKYVFSEQKYRSITRIGKTIVMVASTEEKGEQVQKLLLEMGY